VLLAAGLSLVVVGGALAASSAGGPLYGARLWLEEATLPSGENARAAAEIARLEARVAELEAAIWSGDRAAAAAALAAYQAIADEALADAAGDQSAIDRLLAALDRHLGVLQRVAAQVPPQAAESINRNIQRTIEHSNAAIQRIESKPVGPANGGEPAAKPVAPAGQGGATPKPQPTPKASQKTPPGPATPPDQPPRPDKAPPGRANH
jgi:hypothetical protein